jgi:hypothetical protein
MSSFIINDSGSLSMEEKLRCFTGLVPSNAIAIQGVDQMEILDGR